MRRLVFALLAGSAVAFSAPLAAQEKKPAKKVQKKQSAAKKKAPAKQSSSQDWGRFNSSAQKDLDKLEKQKKAGK